VASSHVSSGLYHKFGRSVICRWNHTPATYCDLLILSLSCPEHLKGTTFLASSIIASPVAGFRPRLYFFSFTQNLLNPLIRTSSPAASLVLIKPIRVLDDFGRLVLGESILLGDGTDQVGLGGGHWF